MTAIDPSSNAEELEKALAPLLKPQEWDPHEGLRSVLANRRDEKPARRRERLTKEQQSEVTSALVDRTTRLLADSPPKSLSEDAIASAFVLARWDAVRAISIPFHRLPPASLSLVVPPRIRASGGAGD